MPALPLLLLLLVLLLLVVFMAEGGTDPMRRWRNGAEMMMDSLLVLKL